MIFTGLLLIPLLWRSAPMGLGSQVYMDVFNSSHICPVGTLQPAFGWHHVWHVQIRMGEVGVQISYT